MDATRTTAQPEPKAVDSAQVIAKSRSYWSTVMSRLSRDPVTLFFGAVVLLIVLSAVFADLIAPADPYKASMLKRLKPIGTEGYPLGADELGRDMLSRLLYGGRLSLTMGISPVAFALVIGGMLGLVAGFIGGKVNMAIMRTIDVFYAFPSVLLAIAISGALGAGVFNAIISLTILTLVAAGLAIYARQQQNEAVAQRDEADRQRGVAEEQRGVAEERRADRHREVGRRDEHAA